MISKTAGIANGTFIINLNGLSHQIWSSWDLIEYIMYVLTMKESFFS